MADRPSDIEQSIAAARAGFNRHAVIYFLLNLILYAVNQLTYSAYQWWLWATFGWGVGVVAHFLSTLVRAAALRARMGEGNE